MKQTKPSILELRSLSPVLDGPVAVPRNSVATNKLPLPGHAELRQRLSRSSQELAAHREIRQLMSFSGKS
jgi:hypothetical protein